MFRMIASAILMLTSPDLKIGFVGRILTVQFDSQKIPAVADARRALSELRMSWTTSSFSHLRYLIRETLNSAADHDSDSSLIDS